MYNCSNPQTRVCTTVQFTVVYCPGTSSNPHAKRLYDDLLHDYNRLIRPVNNFTETLTVKLGLRLSQLIDVVSIQGGGGIGMLQTLDNQRAQHKNQYIQFLPPAQRRIYFPFFDRFENLPPSTPVKSILNNMGKVSRTNRHICFQEF